MTNRKRADGSTIGLRIHTHCLAVVCLQTTRRGRFGDENEPCCGSTACEPYRSSSPFTPQFTTVSTRKDTFTHVPISSLTAPRLSPSGANFVPHRFVPIAGTETGPNSSDTTPRRGPSSRLCVLAKQKSLDFSTRRFWQFAGKFDQPWVGVGRKTFFHVGLQFFGQRITSFKTIS